MVRIEKILEAIDHTDYLGKKCLDIKRPTGYQNQENNTITWAKNNDIQKTITKGVVISNEPWHNEGVNYIVAENPRKSFAQVLALFETHHEFTDIVNPYLIGLHTTVIHSTIESNVKIGANCTIGGVGFGYEEGELIPHIGRVRICEGVEIGNNVCIDRAVMGETIIGKNVKIDNLVHIAHGVEIGENSMIIANAMIGGSVKIGRNVWVAPSASIINGVTIGDNAIIGMGAVVLRDVEKNQKIVGNHRIL